ncbi:MAG: type VI secretion system tip protein TssI/VgrG [Limnobacter sp.]|nr:type VI secretion system tip protein TssI/VgrG [Limnobacter sp.]
MSEKSVKLTGSVSSGILDKLVLRQASVNESFSEDSSALLVVDSPNQNLSPEDFLGETLCLDIKTSAGRRYYHGIVVSMAHMHDTHASKTRYQLTVSSWTELLKRNQDFWIYQDKTIPAIIEEVFKRNGRGGSDYSLAGLSKSYPALEYCVQFGETDASFVRRLMEQEGIYFYFKHQAGSHTMMLVDHAGHHQPFPGYASIPYSPNHNQWMESEMELIHALGFAKVIRTPKYMLKDYNFKKPSDPLEVKAVGPQTKANSKYEKYDFPGNYPDTGKGQHYVDVRREEEQAKEKVMSGTARCRGIAVGHVVTATEHQVSGLQEPMLIASIQMVLTLPDQEANTQRSSGVECGFGAVPLSTPFRPGRPTPKPKAHGIYLAKVVGPPGEEIHTDEFGRVRVFFFWDRNVRKMEEASCWIRVAQPMAGKGWGFASVPRIGQEVLIEFENGDPDRPILTGRIHNAEQEVTYPLVAEKTVSGIKTRSTLQGGASEFNELRFEDKKGEEYVYVQAQKDFFCLTKNDRHDEIRRDHFVHIHRNRQQIIQGSDSLETEGASLSRINGQMQTHATGEWVLHSDSTVSVSSKSDLIQSTDAQYSLNAGSDGQIKVGTQLNVSAGETITLSAGGCSIIIGPNAIYLNGPVIQGGGAIPAQPRPAEVPEIPDATPTNEVQSHSQLK